jgi:hypothetical protein
MGSMSALKPTPSPKDKLSEIKACKQASGVKAEDGEHAEFARRAESSR